MVISYICAVMLLTLLIKILWLICQLHSYNMLLFKRAAWLLATNKCCTMHLPPWFWWIQFCRKWLVPRGKMYQYKIAWNYHILSPSIGNQLSNINDDKYSWKNTTRQDFYFRSRRRQLVLWRRGCCLIIKEGGLQRLTFPSHTKNCSLQYIGSFKIDNLLQKMEPNWSIFCKHKSSFNMIKVILVWIITFLCHSTVLDKGLMDDLWNPPVLSINSLQIGSLPILINGIEWILIYAWIWLFSIFIYSCGVISV